MNICDHPNSVSIGGSWEKERRLRRVPIIVTGMIHSTLINFFEYECVLLRTKCISVYLSISTPAL